MNIKTEKKDPESNRVLNAFLCHTILNNSNTSIRFAIGKKTSIFNFILGTHRYYIINKSICTYIYTIQFSAIPISSLIPSNLLIPVRDISQHLERISRKSSALITIMGLLEISISTPLPFEMR